MPAQLDSGIGRDGPAGLYVACKVSQVGPWSRGGCRLAYHMNYEPYDDQGRPPSAIT